MSDISSTRLADLWTRHQAGEALSAEERNTLADAFAADEVFRMRVLHDHRLEGALRAEAELQRSQPRMIEGLRHLLRAAARSDRFVARLRPRLESAAVDARLWNAMQASRATTTRRAIVAGVAVAAALTAAFIGLRPAKRPGPTHVARSSARPAARPVGKTPAEQVAGIAARGPSSSSTSRLVVDQARRAVLLTGGDDEPQELLRPSDHASDEPLRVRLEELGYHVTVLPTDAPQLIEQVRDARVVVFSPSVYSRGLTDELVDLPIPMVALESSAHDRLGLTGPAWNRDIGPSPSPISEVIITNPTQPLAAGLSGQVTVMSRRQRVRWGVPGSEGISIASYPGAPAHHSLLWAYEPGALTPGGTAPARRVAMFLGNSKIIRRLTPTGWKLFDTAVTWSAEEPR